MCRILIIDENEVARRRLGTLLEDLGHVPSYAGSVTKGLELYDAATFDLVVVALGADPAEGLRALLNLRQYDPWCPLLAVRGGSAGGADPRDYGAWAELPTPLTAESVGAIVPPFLGRERPCVAAQRAG